MHLRHLVAALAALALFVFSLQGCSRSDARPDGRVVIRYAYWGDIEDVRVWEELARRFNARQSGIHVKLEHIAGQAYHPKLMAMTVGGNPPDTMAADDEPFPELANNGLFEDLSTWVERDLSVREADFYPQFREAWRFKGRLYSLPYVGFCLLMFYNREMVRSVGLRPPPDDWTWDDFTRYAKALTRDLNGDQKIDEFGYMRTNFFYALPWIWGAGGNELNPDMTRCLLNTPEAKQGFQFAHDLTHKHHVTPLLSELPGMPLETMFLTGKVAMVMNSPWWVRRCRQSQALDWDVAHMPAGPKGQLTRTTCEGISMSRMSRHKAEAWQWIKFVVSDEGQEVISAYERGMPAVRRVAERVYPRPDTSQHEERFLEAMDYARIQRIGVKWGENNVVINREWDMMMLGMRTPDQVAESITRQVNQIATEDRP